MMNPTPTGCRTIRFDLAGLLVLGLLAFGTAACHSGRDGASRAAADGAGADTVDVLRRLTVLDVLRSDDRFSAFTSAVDSARVEGQLTGRNPVTVFVPTNDAFAGVARGISGARNRPRLRAILLHYVAGRNLTDDVLRQRDSLRVASLEGERLTIRHDSGGTFVNGVPLRNASITVGNGTVHVLNGVLNPPLDAPGAITPPARTGPSRSSPARRPSPALPDSGTAD
ncbi:MAG TPA: fasciclin domain-containing protein [Rhodothermales bacterium]|nr:fasciclin domain-containing protein [Rhodothermales bacterium]